VVVMEVEGGVEVHDFGPGIYDFHSDVLRERPSLQTCCGGGERIDQIQARSGLGADHPKGLVCHMTLYNKLVCTS